MYLTFTLQILLVIGSELSAKTADDSRNEFVNGEAVFYQNGSWEYSELSKTFKDDELAMIPIYFGVDDAKSRVLQPVQRTTGV